MDVRILGKTDDKVELLVNAGFYGDFGSNKIDPNVARISFTRDEVVGFRGVIAIIEGIGWDDISRASTCVEWLYDDEGAALGVENICADSLSNEITELEGDFIRLSKNGYIDLRAFGTDTGVEYFVETIDLSELESIFGIVTE